MGNFIRFPNIIFAKFYPCKKALKSLVFFSVLMEKGLVAKFSESSGGVLKNSFSSFSSTFSQKAEAAACRAPRARVPCPGRHSARMRTPSAVPCFPPSSLAPSSLCSQPEPNPNPRCYCRHTAPSLRPLPGLAEDAIGSVDLLHPSL